MSEIVLPEDWIQPRYVEFIGMDSNAGAIIGSVMRALRRAGNPESVIKDYAEQAMSDDYGHLLRVSMIFANYDGNNE